MSGGGTVDLDEFYSQDSPRELRRVLGDQLLYHHGYFEDDEVPVRPAEDLSSLTVALRRAVHNFYPQIPDRARVLDAGCGWGGVTRMLAEDKGCRVRGVTISRRQARYCRGLGLDVVRADLESDLLEGEYDAAMLFESLSHVRDKDSLLRRLRRRASRLLLSVNCLDESVRRRGTTFGGSMVLCSRAELLDGLDRAGWSVTAESDRRFQALPTLICWRDRLDRLYGDREPPGHLGVLRRYAQAALASPADWCRAHPLLDIVAS